MKEKNAPLERLKHHATGAIERGEKVAIVGKPAMKENKHTPGPWTINAYGYYESSGTATGRQHVAISKHDSPAVSGYLISAPNSTIAEIKGTNSRLPDAHLIASAPELVELLQDAEFQLSRLTGENLLAYARTFSALARQAIAKAKGGV